MKIKIVNKKKFYYWILIIIVLIVLLILLLNYKKEEKNKKENETAIETASIIENNTQIENTIKENIIKKEIKDWRLTLVNIDNTLPEDYKIELANYDESRQFDARAIDELKRMIIDARKAGAKSLWIQSAYRSIELQKAVFEEQVEIYKKQGKTQEEAEELTLKIINKPGTSDHNLGLAVDFNYSNEEFEKDFAFEWLSKNAEDYGFILRYPKNKVAITKVAYEPWHWRYVGKEHAIEMNKLGYCLEEYVEYLKTK